MEPKDAFSSLRGHENPPARVRKARLRALRESLCLHEGELLSALNLDLGKSPEEGYMTELGLVYDELSYCLRRLSRFCKGEKAKVGLANFPGKGKVIHDPYGRVLILAPWNYPVLLSLQPLIGAIAAGNSVAIKPSELSPACSSAIRKVVESAFDKDVAICLEGGATTAKALLSLPFDMVFYTGSTKVGREVYSSCAEKLIPCVLELGGKSPVLALPSADLTLLARRLAFGKCLNAGQTCVAPDYLLLPKGKAKEFAIAFEKAVASFYPPSPLSCPFYPHIVSKRHFDRLKGLLDGEKPLYGGEDDGRRIAPTLLSSTFESKAMGEEIFGPILPIIEYDDLDSALSKIASLPTPLAFYCFGKKKEAERIASMVDCGAAVINDTIMHLSSHNLPFGGKGGSGLGCYHGPYSLLCFSRPKAVLIKGKVDVKLRYPPFTKRKDYIIRKIVH